MLKKPETPSLSPSEVAIARLTSKQRAHLRALSHSLRPVVHVGKEGVTAATASAVREALNTRELVKVKVLDNAPLDARGSATAMVEALEGVHVVQVMGRTVLLYRPDPDQPKIAFPR